MEGICITRGSSMGSTINRISRNSPIVCSGNTICNGLISVTKINTWRTGERRNNRGLCIAFVYCNRLSRSSIISCVICYSSCKSFSSRTPAVIGEWKGFVEIPIASTLRNLRGTIINTYRWNSSCVCGVNSKCNTSRCIAII